MRQKLIEENILLKKEPKTNDNLEMIDENDNAINQLTEDLADEIIAEKNTESISEESKTHDKLFESILHNAIGEAFKFIIPAADDLTMYDWDDKKLREEGYPHLVDPREALAWIEENDNDFHKPVLLKKGSKLQYVGSFTFNYVCSSIGADHNRIRSAIEDLIDMPKEEIEIAYERFRNMNSMELHEAESEEYEEENDEWKSPTLQEEEGFNE